MINITVNNTEHQFKAEISLEEVLQHAQISTNGIAVAINYEVIPKSDWGTHQIQDNDAILIIKATQGG